MEGKKSGGCKNKRGERREIGQDRWEPFNVTEQVPDGLPHFFSEKNSMKIASGEINT